MKSRYVWAGIALALGGTAAGGALLTGDADASVPPYRFKISRASDPDAEIKFLEERVRRNDGALDRAELAAAYAGKGKRTGHPAWYVKAEETARQSLALLPAPNEGARIVLARVAEARHDFAESLRLAAEILSARPNHNDALALAVTSNLALGRVDEASIAAERLVELRPILFHYTLRALTRAAAGRDEEAVEDFVRGIRREDVGEHDVSAWARALLGRAHLRRGRLKPAKRLLEEALRIQSGNPLILHLLGELHEARGDKAEAERHYLWASSEGHDPTALISLARVKGSEALYEEAESQIRKESEANRFGHRGALARLLLERGRAQDLPEALTLAGEEARSRKNPETLETLAWALSRAERWVEARRAVQQALRPGVRDAALYGRAARIEEALGHRQSGRLYAQLARQTNPFSEITP